MWLRRGSREEGENREKFRKTIFSQTRMAMKIRSGVTSLDEIPDPDRLSIAYESVKARAVELTHEAKLDAHSAELVLRAVQAAYATLSFGPNMADLVTYRLLPLVESGITIADFSPQTTQWAQDQVVAYKISPANSFEDDDEAITAAILERIKAEG